MHLSPCTTFSLLTVLLSLTTAQQSTDPNGCSTFEPTSAFQILSSSPNLTQDLTIPDFDLPTTNNTSTRRFKKAPTPSRRSAKIPFTFELVQDANNTNRQDLVVAFAGLPCTSGPGPFSFEFNFRPDSLHYVQGRPQIDMFRVDTPALGDAPTWNSIRPLTGALVGTFDFPDNEDARPAVFFLNQLLCADEVVLRFGISLDGTGEAAVAYVNSGGMGLRVRGGC